MGSRPLDLSNFKAVIIDVDDTLSLTEEGCFHLENEVLRQMGRPAMTRHVHKTTWGSDTATAIARRSPGVDVEKFQRLWPIVHQEFLIDNRVDVIPPQNLEAIDKLRRSGLKIFLLTSRTYAELKHMMEPDHELANRVDSFYYWDNMEYHKPDPRAFLHIEKDHGLKPSECVYAGDSPSDAAASTKAGLSFIACLESGLRPTSEFEDYEVLAFIDHFADVANVHTN